MDERIKRYSRQPESAAEEFSITKALLQDLSEDLDLIAKGEGREFLRRGTLLGVSEAVGRDPAASPEVRQAAEESIGESLEWVLNDEVRSAASEGRRILDEAVNASSSDQMLSLAESFDRVWIGLPDFDEGETPLLDEFISRFPQCDEVMKKVRS